MKIFEGEEVRNKLEVIAEKLKEIILSDYPEDPALEEEHWQKKLKAEAYLKEIDEVEMFYLNEELGLDIKLLPRRVDFDRWVAKSKYDPFEGFDPVELEELFEDNRQALRDYEGKYCDLAIVSTKPGEKLYLLYVMPIRFLNKR